MKLSPILIFGERFPSMLRKDMHFYFRDVEGKLHILRFNSET